MITPEIINENLVLHVEGMDKVWALKNKLTIPLRHITDARMDEEVVKKWFHGIKFPGSNVPGVLTAGTFYQHGKRAFWDIHTPKAALIISLVDESYDEMVIEVRDPQALIEDIQAFKKSVKNS